MYLLAHDVDIGDAAPIKQRFYRVSSDKRKLLDKEVQYMLDNHIAEPCVSSWASPCLLVSKPDTTFRPCTDFRKVNNVTKPDVFPLPRMEDCIDQVGSAVYVTKLDLLKGYWQVPLSKRAKEICAFITPSAWRRTHCWTSTTTCRTSTPCRWRASASGRCSSWRSTTTWVGC